LRPRGSGPEGLLRLLWPQPHHPSERPAPGGDRQGRGAGHRPWAGHSRGSVEGPDEVVLRAQSPGRPRPRAVPRGRDHAMKHIQIDRKRRLRDEPGTGHNRFHPDLPPIVTIEEGEEVVLDTRDGVDGQLGPSTTETNIASMEAGAVHPLTGPVFVKGAQPGDVLEVEFLDIVPQPHAFTAIVPGLGFLRDVSTTPFLVHWQIRDGWATSPRLRGVRIPGAPFMGVSGVRLRTPSSARGPRASRRCSTAAASSFRPTSPARFRAA